MMVARARTVVLLGMLTSMPVGGNLWLVVHYLLGLRRLGYDTWYVEAHGVPPTKFMQPGGADGSAAAAAYLAGAMRRFGFEGQWAYHARHRGHLYYGMSASRLARLYESADLIINLHGGTDPLPEHAATGRLVYLETDPVDLGLRFHEAPDAARAFASPYMAMFTWGENYGAPDCRVPVPDAFDWRLTRAPVLADVWAGDAPAGDAFTTIGNWRQSGAGRLNGEVYRWSKHFEFKKVLDLPSRTGLAFELALGPKSVQERDRVLLARKGWRVRDALAISTDPEIYRRYVQQSRGEFTVAKDQNVRLRSGWFSERSATYLAAGRPVVTQDTGFDAVLPTGEGLFAFRTIDDAEAALEAVNADYARHCRAARDVAQTFFNYDVVLPRLLADAGVDRIGKGGNMQSDVSQGPAVRFVRPGARLGPHSEVAALIPHHRCEHWLPECLESLVRQTRPLEAIVVIDDASEEPPTDIVRRFPAVTLLRSRENVGPYRLIQQVMNDTAYDAYLFQDADDWSAPERLEALLAEAARTGAEMVGGQEVRVRCMEGEVLPFLRPLDANAALADDPGSFPVLHPTSLVSRDLVMRVGGFATGMRFGGDAEFLRRAACVARVVNAPHFGYFRRIRPGSLTMAPATGLRSPARRALIQELRARAEANADVAKRGGAPDLTPYRIAGPVRLDHLAGPPLKSIVRTGPERQPSALNLNARPWQ